VLLVLPKIVIFKNVLSLIFWFPGEGVKVLAKQNAFPPAEGPLSLEVCWSTWISWLWHLHKKIQQTSCLTLLSILWWCKFLVCCLVKLLLLFFYFKDLLFQAQVLVLQVTKVSCFIHFMTGYIGLVCVVSLKSGLESRNSSQGLST